MVKMVELRYSEGIEELVVSGITIDKAKRLGEYLLEELYPSEDSFSTGVTGTYDPETGRLRILCPGSVSEEVRRNLGLCFPAVGVNSSKGDDVVHGQFGMQLNPETYSGDDVKEFLGNYGYNVRLSGEPLQEQEVLDIEGLNVGPPVKLEEVLGKEMMVEK